MQFSPRLLNIAGATSLVSGISLFTKRVLFSADLTGQGSTVVDGLHQAATDGAMVASQPNAGLQLLSGIILILVAFFLHALAKSQNDERSVHITVKPTKKQKTWFWVEMRLQ